MVQLLIYRLPFSYKFAVKRKMKLLSSEFVNDVAYNSVNNMGPK